MYAMNASNELYPLPQNCVAAQGPLTRTDDGQIRINSVQDKSFEDSKVFKYLRPWALKAFQIAVDGWLTYEEIWDYVEFATPTEPGHRIELIRLLNSDKEHFYKDIKKFATLAGGPSALFRRTREKKQNLQIGDESSTPYEEMIRGNISKDVFFMLSAGIVPSPYSLPVQLNTHGEQLVKLEDLVTLNFLKTHVIRYNARAGQINFSPFEVKLVEVEEPLPRNLSKKIKNYKDILIPNLCSPRSYVTIVQFMKYKLLSIDPEEIRVVLKHTLQERQFEKCGRNKVEGNYYKTVAHGRTQPEIRPAIRSVDDLLQMFQGPVPRMLSPPAVPTPNTQENIKEVPEKSTEDRMDES